MGGSGSGNRNHWWRTKKTTVEDSIILNSSRLMRDRILRAGVHIQGTLEWNTTRSRSSVGYKVNTVDPLNQSFQLTYSWTWSDDGVTQQENYAVRLTTTQPPFGGLRFWFICPLVTNSRPCRRRVGKLYLPPEARYFGCRHCHQLTYTSCQESHKHDTMYRFLARQIGSDFETIKRSMKAIGGRTEVAF